MKIRRKRQRGIDMMVYSRTKGLEEDQRMSSKIEIGWTQIAERPVQYAESGRPGTDGRREKGWREVEKKEDKTKNIIRSRTGRRSCRLRDRTQNDAGVPPGSGTTHRKPNRCTYERVRMVVMVLVARETGGTRMMMRNQMNESSTASSFLMMFGKLKPM